MQTSVAWLLTFSLASTVVLVAAAIVNQLLSKRSGAMRHFVWIAAFAIVFVLPAGSLLLPSAGIAMPFVHVASPVKSVIMEPSALPNEADLSSLDLVGPATGETTLDKPVASSDYPTSPLFSLYGVGVAAIALQGILIAAALGHIRRRRSVPAAVTGRNVVGRAGLRRAFELRICSGPYPPAAMTWGFKPPVVLLPEGAVNWPQERLEAVLLHELAHVRRFDSVSQTMALIVCALHWFNPVAWLCAKALRAEAETAADDVVLQAGIAPSVYADALIRIAAALGTRRQPLASIGVPLMKKSKIEKRIAVILNPRVRRGTTLVEMLAVLCGGIALFAPLALLRPQSAPDVPSGPTAQTAPLPPVTQAPPRADAVAPIPPQAAKAPSPGTCRTLAGRKASRPSAHTPQVPSPHPADGAPLPPRSASAPMPRATALPQAGTPSPSASPATLPQTPQRTLTPVAAPVPPGSSAPAQGQTLPPAQPGVGTTLPVQRIAIPRQGNLSVRSGTVAPLAIRTQRSDVTIVRGSLRIQDAVRTRSGSSTLRLAPARVQGGVTVTSKPQNADPSIIEIKAGKISTRTAPASVRTGAPSAITIQSGPAIVDATRVSPARAATGPGSVRVSSQAAVELRVNPARPDVILTSGIGDVTPSPALKRHLATLGSLREKLAKQERLIGSLSDVDLAKTRLDIASIQYKIAVEVRRLRSHKGR